MKISPFEKAIVSNIKDLILAIISVEWLLDFEITIISGFGIVICLAGSFIFSIPVLFDEEERKDLSDPDEKKKLMNKEPEVYEK